jgi:pimeloyl-ACP methyl ester carboxylesterase
VTVAALADFRDVVAEDGTRLAYRQLGKGPGLVVLHGVMESSWSHIELARALADDFTLYLPDRRGCGSSGATDANYTMATEVADLSTLLATTGARLIFGVSSGALICLRASLLIPAVRAAALFEPPLSVNGSVPNEWLARVKQHLARGETSAALVTAMLDAQMGPPVFNKFPRWLLRGITWLSIKIAGPSRAGGEQSFGDLASTLPRDGGLLSEMAETSEDYRCLKKPVLLLGGSASPDYLKLALSSLEGVLSNVRRVELPGMGHQGTGNKNRGGQPEVVAQTLKQFFTKLPIADWQTPGERQVTPPA